MRPTKRKKITLAERTRPSTPRKAKRARSPGKSPNVSAKVQKSVSREEMVELSICDGNHDKKDHFWMEENLAYFCAGQDWYDQHCISCDKIITKEKNFNKETHVIVSTTSPSYVCVDAGKKCCRAIVCAGCYDGLDWAGGRSRRVHK